MPWYTQITFGVVVWMAGGAVVVGQEPGAKPKAKVEFRWVESKQIDGVTEAKGVQFSEGPGLSYPHKKPALVLTAAEVSEVRLVNRDLSRNGLAKENYRVILHLTKEARDKLAAACGDNQMRLLTVVVDGKYWGLRRYETGKDKDHVPAQARAETFLPDVGYFSSKAEAQRLVDALK